MLYLETFPRYSLRHVQHRYIWLSLLRLTPTEKFAWDYLRKILRGDQRMARNIAKNFNRLSMHEHYRRRTTYRQTDRFAIASTRKQRSHVLLKTSERSVTQLSFCIQYTVRVNVRRPCNR